MISILGVILLAGFLVQPLTDTLLLTRAERYLVEAMPKDLYDQAGGNYCDTALRESIRRENIVQARDFLQRISSQPIAYPGRVSLLLGRSACLMGDAEAAVRYYQDATQRRPGNPLFHLELGFALEAAGREKDAVTEWKAAGQDSGDFLVATGLGADDFNVTNREGIELLRYEKAVRWMRRAMQMDPNNPGILTEIGRLCQVIGYAEADICGVALNRQAGNLLLGWEPGTAPVWHASVDGLVLSPNLTEPCPAGVCLGFENNAQQPAGFYQCTALEPEKDYRASSWVRVSASETTTWTALAINGAPELQRLSGGTDWIFYERTINASNVPGNTACLYPVLMGGIGKVEFHSPRLEMIE